MEQLAAPSSPLLRGDAAYDGVVCTDWGVTRDVRAVDGFGTTPWGAETLTVAQRHYKILMAGVDQFGGNNEAGPVLEAWRMGVAEHGEEWMRARMEQSAVRLLTNIFRVGLFENPYLDPEETARTVGSPDFMKAGYAAQLRSVVMLKNRAATLPAARGGPSTSRKDISARRDFFGREEAARPTTPSAGRSWRNTSGHGRSGRGRFRPGRRRQPRGGAATRRTTPGRGNATPVTLQYRPTGRPRPGPELAGGPAGTLHRPLLPGQDRRAANHTISK